MSILVRAKVSERSDGTLDYSILVGFHAYTLSRTGLVLIECLLTKSAQKCFLP